MYRYLGSGSEVKIPDLEISIPADRYEVRFDFLVDGRKSDHTDLLIMIVSYEGVFQFPECV